MKSNNTTLGFKAILILLVSINFQFSLSAQSTTWTGTIDTDWNTPGNWDNGVPTTTTDVTIGNVTNDPVISANDAVAKSVTVNPSGHLTINSSGKLTIDGAASDGIVNLLAIIDNSGTLDIGTTSTPGSYGLRNNGTFNNNTNGIINIDRSTNYAIYNQTGTFNNEATVTIGAVASAGSTGIYNNAIFNNNTNGIINIDQCTTMGIRNNPGSTFTNEASISIGTTSSTGMYGIYNEAIFNNNSGDINIDRSTSSGIHNINSGTFTNVAAINIGGIASPGSTGISNNSTFNNNTNGIINIDRSTQIGLYNQSGTFTNEATITIGATASVGFYGIQDNVIFNNNSGNISIDRFSIYGIYASNGTFTNEAMIIIGAQEPITNLLSGLSGGMITNNTGGTLKGSGTIASTYLNQAGGTLEPGYSPGTMTFSSDEDFSDNTMIMEIDGPTTPGVDFDQIDVTGTATVGASTFLEVVFSYAVPDGESFDILTATSVSGTIPPGNISFSNVGTGNVTAINLSYPGGNIIRVTAETPLPVDLVSFTGKKQNGQVQLNWNTAAEFNNQGFEVERCGQDLQWQEIGFVEGKGSAEREANYLFWDRTPISGTNYYRLRQIDHNGKVEYSEVVTVDLELLSAIHIAPNPVLNGQFTLSIDENTEPRSIQLRIFDTSGRLVKSEKPGTGLSWNIQCTDLPKGLYYLELQVDEKRFYQKILIP